MKLVVASVLALLTLSAGAARADDDSPQITIAKAWMAAALSPTDAVTAPDKAKPLPYVVLNGTKSCKKVKTGVAKDAKAAAKLEKCLADTHKIISESPTEADWDDSGGSDVDSLVSMFPKKHRKKIKSASNGTTIVFAHYIGDGHNMDVYLAIGTDGTVRGVWVLEDFFE